MTQLRPAVRGQIRSPVRFGLAAASGLSFHDGISFNAATGRVVVKAPGAAPSIGTLASLFTFTGGNQSLYMGPAGVLVASATNTPRIEYGPGGDVLGLLMEASRTNLALNNADLSNASWTKNQCSVTTATSADGTTRNIRIVEDGTTNVHGVIAGVTISANTTYCLSAIVKANTRTKCFLYGTNVDQFGAIFDLSALTATNILSGTSSINQKGVREIGGGRYLVWVSGILNAASTTLNFVGGPAISTSVPAGYNYAGDGSSSVDMEYIQIELGAFPSSRISTAGTTVARTADSCIRTLGSEFSATVGTVVVQGRASGGQDAANGNHFWDINNTTTSNRIRMFRLVAADTARLQVTDATVTQALLDATFANLTPFKHASAWAANDFAASFNGAAVLTDAAGTVPTLSTLGIGCSSVAADSANGHIKAFDYYPARLANNYLQQVSA